MSVATVDVHPQLVELTASDRIGLKGRGSAAWLAARGLELPAAPNRLAARADGLVVARYGKAEFAIAELGGSSTGAVAELRRRLAETRPAACYPVPRNDGQAVFELTGNRALPALSMVCPADLRPKAFRPGDVLQTLCAGVGAQIWNLSMGESTRIVVLCDITVRQHQLAALNAAMIASDA
ncbi:MAG: hypothetical protein AB7G13_15695 [Lautropia sp.]